MLKTKPAASYPRGACPHGRRFAMSMQLELLGCALAPWPRRQSPLLEVNCGNGAFLRFLWQCGFDVQGAEADSGLRARAQNQQIPGLEVVAASDDDLPFENDSFDWVIIHLKSGRQEGIASCANEGARLARRGIMLTFWNRTSVPAFCWALAHRKPWAINSASWWRVWRQMQQLGIGRLSTMSTLVAPAWMWRRQWRLGGVLAGLPLGAWCAIRLDMGSATPVTPLPLRLRAAMPGPEPVMDYAPGSTSTSSNKAE